MATYVLLSPSYNEIARFKSKYKNSKGESAEDSLEKLEPIYRDALYFGRRDTTEDLQPKDIVLVSEVKKFAFNQ